MSFVTRTRAVGILSAGLLLIGSLGATPALAGSIPPLTIGDAHELGWVAQGDPNADSDRLAYVNHLVGMGVGTTDAAMGQTFTRSGNAFGSLPKATLDGHVGGTGTLIDVGSGGTNSYLFAKYDGPSDGSEVWYVGNLSGLVSIPAFHNAYGIASWTLLPQLANQPDARIRRIGQHNMVGNDIYNSDGTNQTLSETLGDRRVRFVITIQNDGDTADSFTIGSSNGVFELAIPPVQFLHGWHPTQDITAAVMAGTYTTPTIQPGGVYRIRAVVRPLQINFNQLAAGPGIPHYSWLVTANSVGNTTKADAVRFVVDVPFT